MAKLEQQKDIFKKFSLDGEIWHEVVDYENQYFVSNFGRVYSTGFEMLDKNGRKWKKNPSVLNGSGGKNGYRHVTLFKNNIRTDVHIHRLVGLHFIPNPENKPWINHIDGNPSNNRIENLEWCTSSENMYHSFYVLKNQFNKNKPINQFSVDGIFVKKWDGIQRIKQELGIKIAACVWNVIKNRTKTDTTKGYKWYYD